MSEKKPEQKPVKPMSEWVLEDYIRAGLNATQSTSTTRTVNSATGIPGAKRTGIQIGTSFDKPGFKFAK